MKLIEKKVGTVVPELIWGNKYVTTSGDTRDGDIEKGTEVLLKRTEIDGDGKVKIESKEIWDYIKPEYLQPITEAKVVEKLVVGQKYRITSDPHCDSFPVGTIVTFVSTELDSDGEIKIYTANDHDYIEPEFLQAVATETSAETIYTVELTEAEAQVITKVIGKTSPYERKDYFEDTGVQFDAGKVGAVVYEGFKEMLGGR